LLLGYHYLLFKRLGFTLRLLLKLSAAMIVAALVPFGIAGLPVDFIARNEVAYKIDQLFTRTSQSGVRQILNYVQDTIVDLTVAVGYLEFDSMNAAGKSGAEHRIRSVYAPSIKMSLEFLQEFYRPIVRGYYES
jgi:hypothetical protein